MVMDEQLGQNNFPFNVSAFAQSLHQDCDYTHIFHDSCPDDLAHKQPFDTQPSIGHCGCLYDSASYQAMLELSLRLRKASDVLGQSPTHRLGEGFCHLHQRILELDLLAMYG